MNARGIALAADSAVSLGADCRKVYNTAEKLFRISPDVPVGLMVFGNAEMMGIPWETVAKGFAQKLAGRTFDSLQEYATNFLSFIEGSTGLFPPERQAEFVKREAEILWSACLQQLNKDSNEAASAAASDRKQRLRKIVDIAVAAFKASPLLDNLTDDYGSLVVKTYAEALGEAESEVFEGFDLSDQDRASLRDLASEYFMRQNGARLASGIVIAGMGAEEPLPGIILYNVGTIAAGRLRYAKGDEGRVGLTCESMIVPFAQTETIDMIVTGLHPLVRAQILSDADRIFSSTPAHKKAELNRKEFRDSLDLDAARRYVPLMTAVSALPRRDLARMAETLVSLTEFAKRMSVEEDESVGGPIDVAILSKADGFTWIRHKDLVQEFARQMP